MKILSKGELTAVLEIISDCTTCTSGDTFSNLALKAGELLQAEHLIFLSSKKVSLDDASSIQEINVSYPTEWVDQYRSRNYIVKDPVISSGQTGLLPWEDLYKASPPEQEFYSQAKSFGLGKGFSHILARQQIFALLSMAGNDVENSPRSRVILNNIAPHLHQLVLSLTHPPKAISLPQLTPRERDVLLWAMEGKSNWEIAVVLGIGQESVKGHIAKILRKLGASNRTHAVAIALQGNLLSPHDKDWC